MTAPRHNARLRSPRHLGLALLLAAACTADDPDDAGTTTVAYPEGTCLDVLSGVANPHPVDAFWACASKCGIDPDNDTYGLPAAQARMSYDLLEPDQPDGCYELRTALYQCFDSLTCPEVAAFREAANAGTDGPCTAEYYALEPHIPACGI